MSKKKGRPRKILTPKDIITKRSKNYKKPKKYKTLDDIKEKILILKNEKNGFIVERIRTNKNQVFFLKYRSLRQRNKIVNKLDNSIGKSGISNFKSFKVESVRKKDYCEFNFVDKDFKLIIQRDKKLGLL